MPGVREPRQAAQQFIQTLGLVTGCVTTERPTVSTRAPFTPGELYTIFFPDSVSLTREDGLASGLLLDISHVFEIVRAAEPRVRWRVSTRMYEYRILDQQETELLVWHWQPGDEWFGPDHPHIHVSATLQARMRDGEELRAFDLDKIHVPTGRVLLEAVVRMLINEFNIRPARANWEAILERSEGKFWEEVTRYR